MANIERCTEIERANKILLDKMTNILSGPATHNRYYAKQNAYSAANLPKSKRVFKPKKPEMASV